MNLMDKPALSIRQPWATFIVHGFKNVENRTWYTDFRGRFLVHAGYRMVPEFERDRAGFLGQLSSLVNQDLVGMYQDFDFPRGGIIGSVVLVDCVTKSDSPWFIPKNFGFLLADPGPLPFVPMQGRPGFFPVDSQAGDPTDRFFLTELRH